MNKNEEINFALHDINNSIFYLDLKHRQLREKLGADYDVLKLYTGKLQRSTNTIMLALTDDLKITTEEIALNKFSNITSSLFSDSSIIYPNISFTTPLLKTNLKVNYNAIVYDQLIHNILENTKKANATSVKIKMKLNEDENKLALIISSEGENYTSDPTSIYHGYGQKIIQRNIQLLDGEVKFIAKEKKYSVILIFKIH